MARQISIVEDLEHKQPMFKHWCEINNLKNGDTYSCLDYINWADKLTEKGLVYFVEKERAK